MLNQIESLIKQPKPFLNKAWKNSNFQAPTPIQQKTIPLILEGEDVIAESPTGSGKTLAYALPLLQVIDSESKNVQAVILASSHELVMQIHQELQKWGEGSGILSITLIGGANVKRQLEKLKKRPQIIVGTPGRVLELINKKKLKVHEVKTLVFDEADQLLIPEHHTTIQSIIKSTLRERQILVFSATLSEKVEQTAKQLMTIPEVVRVQKEEVSTPPVDHIYLIAEAREKIEVLRKLVRNSDMKALAFMKDAGHLDVLAEKLAYKGMDAGVIHGNVKKQERANAINGFRSGKYTLALATDVAARGLDIKDITHIINIDLPGNAEQYVHRSGRIGRLGTEGGTVITIITSEEEKQLKKYSKDLHIPITKKTLFKGEIKDPK